MKIKNTLLSLSIAAALGLTSTAALANNVCNQAYFHLSNDTKAQTVRVVRVQGSSLQGISKGDIISPGGAQLVGTLNTNKGYFHDYKEQITIAVSKPGQPSLLTTTLTANYNNMAGYCVTSNDVSTENGDGVYVKSGDSSKGAHDSAGAWFHVHDD